MQIHQESHVKQGEKTAVEDPGDTLLYFTLTGEKRRGSPSAHGQTINLPREDASPRHDAGAFLYWPGIDSEELGFRKLGRYYDRSRRLPAVMNPQYARCC